MFCPKIVVDTLCDLSFSFRRYFGIVITHFQVAVYTARRDEMVDVVQATLFYMNPDAPIPVHSPYSALPSEEGVLLKDFQENGKVCCYEVGSYKRWNENGMGTKPHSWLRFTAHSTIRMVTLVQSWLLFIEKRPSFSWMRKRLAPSSTYLPTCFG